MYNELNVDKDITIGKDGKECLQPKQKHNCKQKQCRLTLWPFIAIAISF